MDLRTLKIIGTAAFGLVMLGAFLPWVKVAFVSVAGTDGDGLITLFLALVGAPLVWSAARPRTGVITSVLAGLCVAVGVHDVAEVLSRDGGQFGFNAAVGAGLWLTVVASLVAMVVSVAEALTLRYSRERELQALGSEPMATKMA